MNSSGYLRKTNLLDFNHLTIVTLIEQRGWKKLLGTTHERIGAVYDFVRDEIRFGYNASDILPASAVLADGYGQCNTKTTLLMALLRAVGVPCRLHGATIHKRLQKGIVNGLFYLIAPSNILHTWTEVFVNGRWVALEGVILDTDYLDGVRRLVAKTREEESGGLLGFGVGTENLSRPHIRWCGEDTFIQRTGVNQDFGVFNDPDSFFAKHGDNLSSVKAWLYAKWIRHVLNRNVERIRSPQAKRHQRLAPPATHHHRAITG